MITQLTLGPGSPCAPTGPLSPRLPFTEEPETSLSVIAVVQKMFYFKI